MKNFIRACLLAGALILCDVVLAASPQTDIADLNNVKIGSVSLFNGEVLIRTQKKWARLKKVPHPLYATDKVVTRRGRAEVVFLDGGRLRLDSDTNISIYHRRQEGIKETGPNGTLQKINILVGRVWFDVKIKQKGRALIFVTPTMTAAIRGTRGGFSVQNDGSSLYKLSSGKALTTGRFSPLNATGPPDIQGWLPPSDPLADQSPLQKAAAAAVDSAELAKKTESKVKAQKSAAAGSDLKARAQASAAATQAAYDRALSVHHSLLEMMIESQRFNIDNEKLRKQIEDSQAALKRLSELVTQANAIAKDVAAAEAEETQQTGLTKLEEIEKQANDLADVTEAALNESFASLSVYTQDGQLEGTPALESSLPPQAAPDAVPKSRETVYEGDLETRTDPSPSQ